MATIRRLQLVQIMRLKELVTSLCNECQTIRQRAREQIAKIKMDQPTDLEGKIVTLTEELRISRNEAQDNRKEADRYQAQVTSLEEDLSDAGKAKQNLLKEIEELKAKNVDLQERVERRENGLERATSPMFHFSHFPLYPDGEPPPFGLQMPESALSLPQMQQRTRRGSACDVFQQSRGSGDKPRRSFGALPDSMLNSLKNSHSSADIRRDSSVGRGSIRGEATSHSVPGKERRVSLQIGATHIVTPGQKSGRRASRSGGGAKSMQNLHPSLLAQMSDASLSAAGSPRSMPPGSPSSVHRSHTMKVTTFCECE